MMPPLNLENSRKVKMLAGFEIIDYLIRRENTISYS